MDKCFYIKDILVFGNLGGLNAKKLMAKYLGRSKLITLRDFIWMKKCDIFIALLPEDANNTPYRSDGTCIEIGWASALGKPIIMLLNESVDYSHLVLGLPEIVNNCKVINYEKDCLNINEFIEITHSMIRKEKRGCKVYG